MGYWIGRMDKGGEILAPGDPLSLVQYIDARDLAEWVVRMVERGEIGTYNAAGPAMPMGIGELLGATRSMFSTPVRFTWIPSYWLIQQGVKTRDPSIFWVRPPESREPEEEWVSYKVSSAKAIGKGLAFRPLATTLQDMMAHYRDLSPENQAKFVTEWRPQSEQQLLTAWHSYTVKAGICQSPSAHG